MIQTKFKGDSESSMCLFVCIKLNKTRTFLIIVDYIIVNNLYYILYDLYLKNKQTYKQSLGPRGFENNRLKHNKLQSSIGGA